MNYQLKMESIIENLGSERPTLLLHACCAPCSSYVLEYLTKFFKITIFYYNPNIYPEKEYNRRLNELKTFLKKQSYDTNITLIEEKYNKDDYDKAILGLETLGEKSKRCYACYKFRLEKAVIYAKEHNFDYFTTTLSISPYKVSDWINEIGSEFEKKYMVNYLYADFKKKNGYKRSLELSSKFNLYRQDYCGCKYSMEAKKRVGNE